MHKLEIPSRNLVIDLPSEIDEMTNEQFVQYVCWVLKYISVQITEVQFKMNLTRILLDLRMNVRYLMFNAQKRHECEEKLVRISALMDGFIEENLGDGKRSFKLKSVRNFVPQILNYHGPRSGFENLTYYE